MDSATGVETRHQPDDVGLARGQLQHSRPASADRQRWPWLLDCLHADRCPVELVMLAAMGDRFASQEPLDQRDRLLEPIDPPGRRVVGHPELAVVTRHPAGPESHLEAPAGQKVERGGFAGQDQRVAVVVGEDERTHAQASRRRGRCRKRGNWRELTAQVVGHDQHVVAERLSPTCEGGPSLTTPRRSLLNGKPKRMHWPRLLRREADAGRHRWPDTIGRAPSCESAISLLRSLLRTASCRGRSRSPCGRSARRECPVRRSCPGP